MRSFRSYRSKRIFAIVFVLLRVGAPYDPGMFLNYLSAIGLKREALPDRRQGVRIQGGRALPERTENCRVCTAHHRSVILFSWVWRVGENSFRGFFEPTGEGSLNRGERHGGKGDVSRAALSAQSETVLCFVPRSCHASPQNGDCPRDDAAFSDFG